MKSAEKKERKGKTPTHSQAGSPSDAGGLLCVLTAGWTQSGHGRAWSWDLGGGGSASPLRAPSPGSPRTSPLHACAGGGACLTAEVWLRRRLRLVAWGEDSDPRRKCELEKEALFLAPVAANNLTDDCLLPKPSRPKCQGRRVFWRALSFSGRRHQRAECAKGVDFQTPLVSQETKGSLHSFTSLPTAFLPLTPKKRERFLGVQWRKARAVCFTSPGRGRT